MNYTPGYVNIEVLPQFVLSLNEIYIRRKKESGYVAYQFTHINIFVFSQIPHNCSVLHPRRNHTKIGRKCLGVYPKERQNMGMSKLLPDQGLFAKRLVPISLFLMRMFESRTDPMDFAAFLAALEDAHAL